MDIKHVKSGEGRMLVNFFAFTLVELLVVIVVIGILAALLLPVLTKAKARAQGIQCLNNLRQMSFGWLLYSEDNGSRYPPNASTGVDHPPVGEDNVNPSWVAGMMQHSASSDNNDIEKLVGLQYTSFSSIGAYIKNSRVYHCPGDRSIDLGSGLPRVRSISMNGWVNPGKVNQHDSAYWKMPFQKFQNSSSYSRASPSDVFVFLDEREETINDGWLYVLVSGYNSDGSVDISQLDAGDLPAIYHNGASSFSFADGHVEFHRWLGGNILNDTDLVWLMTHATAPQ